MRCRHCGAEIIPGTTLCSQCGTNVARRQAPIIRCRHCGRRVPAQGSLCPACGAELHRSWRQIVLAAVALALVGASYYLVAEVVTVARIKRQVEHLPRFTLASLLPPPTATLTPQPTRTIELRPTPTRIPTITPTASMVPTATITATEALSATPTATASPPPATATATRRPATATATRRAAAAAPTTVPPTATSTAIPPTATPAFPYSVVTLVAPPSGAVFIDAGTAVVLSWNAVDTLTPDEYYGLSVRYWLGNELQYTGAWIKETSWRLPRDLFAKCDPAKRTFEWDVRIMKRVDNADGTSVEVALSPPSETRQFVWR